MLVIGQHKQGLSADTTNLVKSFVLDACFITNYLYLCSLKLTTQ